MLTIVTGWSPAGWIEYGQRFVESFHKHWPLCVKLITYTEEPVSLPRGECRSLWDIPGAREFIDRHKDRPAANGKKPGPKWKPNAIRAGYNWRFDAVKFCRQGFIPLHAAQGLSGLMCWLDADVVTFKDVAPGQVESLLPASACAAYLGRVRMHSEIGFQLYRLPEAMPILQRFRDLFATDEIFNYPEWHSAYAWDIAREHSGLRCHNLTPNGTGHVWFQSPLGNFCDHLKGKRKALAASHERR